MPTLSVASFDLGLQALDRRAGNSHHEFLRMHQRDHVAGLQIDDGGHLGIYIQTHLFPSLIFIVIVIVGILRRPFLLDLLGDREIGLRSASPRSSQ